jgi:hypothetical protein
MMLLKTCFNSEGWKSFWVTVITEVMGAKLPAYNLAASSLFLFVYLFSRNNHMHIEIEYINRYSWLKPHIYGFWNKIVATLLQLGRAVKGQQFTGSNNCCDWSILISTPAHQGLPYQTVPWWMSAFCNSWMRAKYREDIWRLYHAMTLMLFRLTIQADTIPTWSAMVILGLEQYHRVMADDLLAASALYISQN